MLDRVVRGARVFDGRRLRDGDVGIAGDRIAFIGAGAPEGAAVTDAAGLLLAPAFIDTHNHGDFHCVDPANDGASALAQGVGAIVVGNCGFSATPACAPNAVLLPPRGAACAPPREHRRRLGGGLPLDVADLMGHGSLRVSVLGSPRCASAGEIALMAATLDEFLDAGGLGMSVGLDYPEAHGYTDEELLALCRVLAWHGRPLTCHLRGIGDDLLAAIDEVAALGDRTGCAVLLSHLRPVPARCDHVLPAILERVETRARLYMDVYPYVAGCTTLAWLFHRSFGALPGPGDALPADRVEAAIDGICAGGFADLIVVAHRDRDVVGRSVAALGGRPGLRAQELLRDDPACLCIYDNVASPESVARILEHPRCFVGSDGYLFSSEFAGACHPRSFAAVTRFLVRTVRAGRLSWEEGLGKLTRAPAAFFGLDDLGEIRAGARANLCLFAPDELEERADFSQPSRAAGGMREVIVGGRTVWRAGQAAAARAGRRVCPGGSS
jgi:N-acyl-D-aspartate/D-glutamate deacylase